MAEARFCVAIEHRCAGLEEEGIFKPRESAALSALEQFNAEITLQFLELPAELALSVRVVTRRGCDAAGGNNLAKRFQPFERKSRLSEQIVEHDWTVILVAFSAINKREKTGFNVPIV